VKERKKGGKVKSIKFFVFAALAALMAMAFVGGSSALAEATRLCTGDPSGSGCGTTVTHIHEPTLPGEANKMIVLSSVITVKCDTLYLGDTLGSLANSGTKLVIHGSFTYTNCSSNCTEPEEEGTGSSSLIELEKAGHEIANVTVTTEIRIICGMFINCLYKAEGIVGTAHGPLLSTETNGDITLTGQSLHRVSGICSEEAFLDIKTTPLSAMYIGF
jgi:hypothetical protein